MSDQPKEEPYDIPLQLPENYNPDPYHGKTIEQILYENKGKSLELILDENRDKTK